jgi:16S rRNA (guanine527-N7)-methyltransferase
MSGPKPEADGAERLVADAAQLGVTLSAADAARLLTLVEELARWNRRFNLTAITGHSAMVTHHLLDSLAVSPDLVGTHIADVGTGAGFPGLPLAVVNPTRQFTLIDSTAKKLRFVAHAAELLALNNVTALHARVEQMRIDTPFDSVVARAFAPLPKLLTAVTGICGPDTRMLAMKGKWPQAELEALPRGWQIVQSRELLIPGLDAARCVISLKRTSGAAGAADVAMRQRP